MKKIKPLHGTTLSDEQQMAVAQKLFPVMPRIKWKRIEPDTEIPEFTEEELDAAICRPLGQTTCTPN